MARQKMSEVELVTRFFHSAPLAVAQTMFEVARGIMGDRGGIQAPLRKTAARKKTDAAPVEAPTEAVRLK